MVLNSNHLNNIEDGIVNISNELSNFINIVYPIGTIYTSSNSTSPASLFGGAWTQLKDRVIVGAGGSYAVNSTGGAETHTLTVDEMPAHTHSLNNPVGPENYGSESGYCWAQDIQSWGYMKTQSVGGGQAHNNMQPYIAKYIWERVS